MPTSGIAMVCDSTVLLVPPVIALPIAPPLEKVEPPVPAAEDTLPVTTPTREKPSTQTTVPAIRGLHPQYPKPPIEQMPTAEEEKEPPVDRSDSSSRESSVTPSSSLTLDQNAALEVSSEARIFGSERSQILSTPNDLDEFNAISLRSRPKDKKGLAKKTKKTKPSTTQPTRGGVDVLYICACYITFRKDSFLFFSS